MLSANRNCNQASYLTSFISCFVSHLEKAHFLRHNRAHCHCYCSHNRHHIGFVFAQEVETERTRRIWRGHLNGHFPIFFYFLFIHSIWRIRLIFFVCSWSSTLSSKHFSIYLFINFINFFKLFFVITFLF